MIVGCIPESPEIVPYCLDDDCRDAGGDSDFIIDLDARDVPDLGADDSGDNNGGNNGPEPCVPTGDVDVPDPEGIDADCDGVDGTTADAIFVTDYGDDAAEGTIADPMRTIQAAIDRVAGDEAKKYVLVAPGFYQEALTLRSGVSVYGGFDFTWRRDLFARPIIRADTFPTVTAQDLTMPTTLEGFTIEPARDTVDGQSVTTVFVRDTEGLTLSRLVVTGGAGGRGVDGSEGEVGVIGQPGEGGENGCEDGTDIICDSCERPVGGMGGVSQCGGFGGFGGRPGKGGNDGSMGEPGTDGVLGGPANGGLGRRGIIGETGDDGEAAEPGGRLVDGSWVGNAGGDGLPGGSGGGGSGGGGGRGGDGLTCDTYGGGGGGGGGGGCGGTGGTGGGPGGASFAILVLASDVLITDCEIIVGTGGPGGSGGRGGAGGEGGAGGPGGTNDGNSQPGGRGGSGGRGGRGGNGGGGAGGPAYGLYSDALWSQRPTNITFVPGFGGRGGSGGTSSGADGETDDAYPPIPPQ